MSRKNTEISKYIEQEKKCLKDLGNAFRKPEKLLFK